jgi:glycosyltransferase involved in cell wall biosynthesis
MENTLKFEIVLVYYKRPQIVLNALDSIKQLQYKNWHLTFIDDSGDDSFKDTLLQYGLDNEKVTYVASFDSEEMKKEQGGSRHGYFMNEAIYTSDSDIVVILCDDDAIVDGYFEYLDEYYQLNPEINWLMVSYFSLIQPLNTTHKHLQIVNTTIQDLLIH